MKEKRTVQTIYMHLHLDEIFALFMARRFGRDHFDGLDTAQVVYHTDLPLVPPAFWAEQRELVLGGGGDFTDEHLSGSKARIPGMSATKLMFEYLAITDPVIEMMVTEVNHFDHEKDCPKTHLATILKIMKVTRKGFEKHAMNFCMRICRAIQMNLDNCYPAAEGETSLEKYCEGIIKERATSDFTDDDARDSVLRSIKKEDLSGILLFGMKSIYHSLVRTGMFRNETTGENDMEDIFLMLIELLYEDQINFWTILRMIRSNDSPVTKFNVELWDGKHIRNIKAACIMSDNAQTHTALRYDGIVISIVKNSKGNVTIQGNAKFAEKEGLIEQLDAGITELCAMNRFFDLGENRYSANWEILRSRGDSPSDPEGFWNLSDYGWLSVYNGTHNHSAPPTCQTLTQIQRNAEHAFNPRRVEAWKAEYGVPDTSWFAPESRSQPSLEVRNLVDGAFSA